MIGWLLACIGCLWLGGFVSWQFAKLHFGGTGARPDTRMVLRVMIPGGIVYQTEGRMAFVLTDLQKVSLSVKFYNHAGTEVPAPAVPAWSSSDAAIVGVAAATDGLTAVAEAETVGSATVTVTAGGVSAVLDFQVTADQTPVTAQIIAGTPEPK